MQRPALRTNGQNTGRDLVPAGASRNIVAVASPIVVVAFTFITPPVLSFRSFRFVPFT